MELPSLQGGFVQRLLNALTLPYAFPQIQADVALIEN